MQARPAALHPERVRFCMLKARPATSRKSVTCSVGTEPPVSDVCLHPSVHTLNVWIALVSGMPGAGLAPCSVPGDSSSRSG